MVDRTLADNLYPVSGGRLVFTDQALLEDKKGIRLETTSPVNLVYCYPAGGLEDRAGVPVADSPAAGILGAYRFSTRAWQSGKGEDLSVEQVGPGRYTVTFPGNLYTGVKDMRLQVTYSGDIGHAFLGNRLVHDNFANGAVWEIGLRDFAGELPEGQMVLYITPLREGSCVNVESAMAGRREEGGTQTAALHQVQLSPVYEIQVS